MALVDDEVAQEELDFINQVIDTSSLSEEEQVDLRKAITKEKPFDIDYKLLKKDKELALNILTSVVAVMNADNEIRTEELSFLQRISKG